MGAKQHAMFVRDHVMPKTLQTPPANVSAPAPLPAPFALSAGQATQEGHPVRAVSACRNCGCERVEVFCPQCGQENADPVVPLGEMAREVFCEFTSTDAKLWVTIRPLLTRPGLLTTEYLSGKRSAYLGPFKLYFLTSALYFLVFSATGGEREMRQSFAQSGQQGITTGYARGQAMSPKPQTHTSRRIPRLSQVQVYVTRAGDWYMDHQSTLMIALLPVFAAGVALLYRRQKRLYAEHLVFSVHTQCFSMLATLPFIALFGLTAPYHTNVSTSNLMMLLSLTVTPFYEFCAFRRVYGPEAKGKTALKTALWMLYKLSIGALTGMLLVFVIVLYLMLKNR